MSRKIFNYSAVVASLLATALFAGCGASNKEGSASLDTVASVGDAKCVQCHSAVVDPLTGEGIIAQYEAGSPHKDSAHANNGNGCEACHGGGAQHNGVGPIPYVNPYAGNGERCASCHKGAYGTNAPTKFADSLHANVVTEDGEAPCNRCHTHEGAVLGATYGFTGNGDMMEDPRYIAAVPLAKEYTQFKCSTCHEHGAGLRQIKTRVSLADGTLVNWNPAKSAKRNDQFNLCTSCHGYFDNDGATIMGSGSVASGTVKAGHHETSWYRLIATTHYDNPATEDIEGYGVRVNGEKPCFDCHGHEAKTNTGKAAPAAAKATIYTDWAQSGHAGGILTAKYAAAATVTVDTTLDREDPIRIAQGQNQVDTVMAAVADVPIETGASCVRCHTSTGLTAFLADPAKGGSVTADAAGVTTTVAATLAESEVGELTTCWGCHSNASNGTLRTLKGTKATTNYTTDLGHTPTGYALYDGKKAFPDVAGSNLCISCHDGRNSNPASVIAASTTGPAGTHYMPAAGVMYVKTGFINFSTGATYLNSLKADLDGGGITSTHRKLGTPAIVGDSHNASFFVAGNLDSNGPCVTCHLGGSHSLKMDQKAIDAVCSKCHDEEAGISITAKADFDLHFLEPQKEVYENAIKLAVDVFNSKQSTITIAADSAGVYRRYYQFGTTTSATAANWTAVATALGMDKTKLFGAISNVTMFSKDAGGFAHARTYSRRLLYDSIDYLDDGIMNQSAGATAVARSLVAGSLVEGKYVKGATATATDTTESTTFLLKYTRGTGAWSTPDRP